MFNKMLSQRFQLLLRPRDATAPPLPMDPFHLQGPPLHRVPLARSATPMPRRSSSRRIRMPSAMKTNKAMMLGAIINLLRKSMHTTMISGRHGRTLRGTIQPNPPSTTNEVVRLPDPNGPTRDMGGRRTLPRTARTAATTGGASNSPPSRPRASLHFIGTKSFPFKKTQKKERTR